MKASLRRTSRKSALITAVLIVGAFLLIVLVWNGTINWPFDDDKDSGELFYAFSTENVTDCPYYLEFRSGTFSLFEGEAIIKAEACVKDSPSYAPSIDGFLRQLGTFNTEAKTLVDLQTHASQAAAILLAPRTSDGGSNLVSLSLTSFVE